MELKSFLAVVEHGGVSAAARSTGLPKSTVSRALAAIEAEAGHRLVLRTTRSSAPTPVGRAFATACRAALNDLDAAFAAARGASVVPEGSLTITAPTLVATMMERGVLSTFITAFPRVQVHLRCTNAVLDLAAEGIDVAIRLGEVADSSLVARRAGEVGSVLVASRRYLARAGTPKHGADLARHACLTFGTHSTWPLLGGPVRVSGPLAADSFPLLHQFARGGSGIAWLPRFLVAQDLARGKLVEVLPRQAPKGPEVWLISAAGRRPTAAARAFLEHAIARLPAVLGAHRAK